MTLCSQGRTSMQYIINSGTSVYFTILQSFQGMTKVDNLLEGPLGYTSKSVKYYKRVRVGFKL